MRTLLSLLLAAASVTPLALAFQNSRPVPPGIREADRLPGPADIPPVSLPNNRRSNPTLLRDQARELSFLAQSIPDEVAEVNNGTLPKDINEKLKRIEKLSKTLRGEIGN